MAARQEDQENRGMTGKMAGSFQITRAQYAASNIQNPVSSIEYPGPLFHQEDVLGTAGNRLTMMMGFGIFQSNAIM